MPADNSDWVLFGFDLRTVGSQLKLAVNQLLWGDEAGIRQRLDPAVALYTGTGDNVGTYVAGVNQSLSGAAAAGAEFEALLLPEEKVLMRKIQLPVSVEADLEEAMLLEVKSSSPFTEGNVCYGWTVDGRAAGSLSISLAICARADVDEQLGNFRQHSDKGDVVPEIWALNDDGRPVVLPGYGETRRYAVYPRRVAWSAGGLALIALCVLLLLAIPSWVRGQHVRDMERQYEVARQEAGEAMQLRESLAQQIEQAESIQLLVNKQFDYHWLLNHLSEQTPDDIYLQKLSAEGTSVRLTGLGDNAATYMNLLANDPVYVEVTAPSAFSRDRRSGLERFALQLELFVMDDEALQ